jgi:hypothetical protein
VGLAAAAFSADGKMLATACHDGFVRIYDVGSWVEKHEWPAASYAQPRQLRRADWFQIDSLPMIDGVAWVGQTQLMILGRDSSVSVAQLPDGKVVRTFSYEPGVATGSPRRVIASPSGRAAAITTLVSNFTYDPATGEKLFDLPPTKTIPGKIDGSASSNGLWLAMRNSYDRLQVWDARTGDALRTWERDHAAEFSGVAMSPDGRLLATSSRRVPAVRIWNAVDGTELATFTGHDGDVLAVQFSIDGKTVYSGGVDSVALQWDLAPVLAKLPPIAAPAKAEEWDKAWNDLASADGAAVFNAQRQFLASGQKGAEAIFQRLTALEIDAKALAKCIAELDHDDFDTREKAQEQLAALGDAVLPEIKTALEKSASAEQQRRLKELTEKIAKMPPPTERTPRLLRAVGLLEAIGGNQGRRGLTKMSHGKLTETATREARIALEMMKAERAP